jgi:ATP-dependent helicase IRC3
VTELRPYQWDAISALERGFAKGEQRLGVSAPTGVGKTVILAELAHRWSRQRVLILVHRDELAEQTYAKLRAVDRRLSVGIVKARRNEGGAAVVVASIQTVGRRAKDGRLRRLAQLGRFGMVICDEAHRSMSAQWQDVLVELGTMADGGPKAAGFSATWVRSDKIGLGNYWQRICFRISISWAVQKGYLVRPVGKAVRVDLDFGGIKRSGSDFQEKALGVAMTDDSIADAIVRSYREFAADRLGVLFAPTVGATEFFADALNAAGFRTECVFGTTPISDRREIYKRSRAGETQILASCGVLAEGFDAPWLSAGILARPTLHPGLFIQQVGRVLRPCPEVGKVDALILDIVGATELHKLNWWQDLTTSVAEDPTIPDPTLSDEDEGLDDFDPMEDEFVGALGSTKQRWNARILGFEDIDLFGEQRAKWHRTAQGVMFVDAGEQLVFVEPQEDNPTGDPEGHWRYGVCSKKTMAGGSWVGEWITTQANAMDQAGDYAIGLDSTAADRGASWRSKARHRAGSPRQIQYAENLGVKNPRDLNAEQLSDAITYVIASRVLSPVATRYQQQ